MLDWLADGIGAIADWLAGHLPQSPFAGIGFDVAEGFRDGLGYLNWLIPFRDILAIFALWLAAILVWRAVRFVMKNIIGNVISREK